MGKTKIAILGTGFISAVHIESITRFVQDAEVVAVCGRNAEHASALAERFGINSVYIDIDELLRESDAEIIDICLPNNLHRDACVKSANAGRHVIVEKPIAMTLEQADEMISTCENNGVLLMYAEELCFTPKYERVRELVSRGAVGEVYMLKQTEKHSGPHSAWFYDKTLAGGGVMMDMGCHSIAWCRHINGNNPIKTVYADMKTVCHGDITDCEDSTVAIVEFENGVTAVVENSWARLGGMDDRIEVYGSKGVSFADIFRGNSSLTYSEEGYDYASEKSGSTQGWTFTVYEEAFNHGYPQELSHFVDCVRNGTRPIMSGEDGRDILEVIYAAYESARCGQKVSLPFSAVVDFPMQLWKK